MYMYIFWVCLCVRVIYTVLYKGNRTNENVRPYI